MIIKKKIKGFLLSLVLLAGLSANKSFCGVVASFFVGNGTGWFSYWLFQSGFNKSDHSNCVFKPISVESVRRVVSKEKSTANIEDKEVFKKTKEYNSARFQNRFQIKETAELFNETLKKHHDYVKNFSFEKLKACQKVASFLENAMIKKDIGQLWENFEFYDNLGICSSVIEELDTLEMHKNLKKLSATYKKVEKCKRVMDGGTAEEHEVEAKIKTEDEE